MATNNNINYTPAPIPGTVTAPVLGNNIDRAPAPVAPGAGTGYVPVVTQPVVVVTEQPVINPPIPAARNSVVVPVAEQPVAAQVAAESTLGPNITASNQQRYITILSNGTVVTNNTSTLDFEGNGFTITSSGVNGAVISINAAAGGYGNSNVSTLLAAFGSNTIVTTGNITGGYILGNGSQLTGLAATYGNANVAANLAAFGSNPISTTGNITGGNILGGANVNATTHTGTTVSVSANITGGNLLTGGLISATGNITGGNLLTGGLFSATGNITGGNISTGVITLTNGATIKNTVGNAIAIGRLAGNTAQGTYATAIGDAAGFANQGADAVALGGSAGQNSQGAYSIGIGYAAGQNSQGTQALAAGLQAGSTSQGAGAVALGAYAGLNGQGTFSVAIGHQAGNNLQANNSIILNATGAILDQTTANTFTVSPVRNDVANTGQVMFYNATSKEITYGNTISVAGNITGGNLLTGGLFSATGNITGSYFIGNGSALTGIVANTTYGNSNVVTLLAGYGSNVISTTGNVTAGNFVGNVVGGGAGTPTISSATNLDLSAASAVRVIGGGTFRLPSLTTAQIANTIAANGDMIYNSSVNKFQGYENSAWANII